MHWFDFLAYFFGGAFLANALPHLMNGISGRSFQSPFAKPPGKGLSSPTVNVLWGFLNLAVAYWLIVHIGTFSIHNLWQVTAVGAGILVMSLMCASAFGRFHSGR
ncbi:MAG: hypothetical protein WAL45_20610 [Terracidiphilus sp.]